MSQTDLPDVVREKALTDTELGRLDETVEEIGVARFIGRINSGVIDPEAGYDAVERYVERTERRPLLSRVAQFLFGREDRYINHSH